MLEDFYIYLKTEKGLCENTIKGYMFVMKHYFKNGYKVTVEDAKKFYLWKLKTTKSTDYHKNICYALKHYFSMKGIELNIKAPKLGEKRREHLSYEEATQFLDSITDLRDKTIVMLQLQTGLRPAEAINIELEDLDLKNRIIRIKHTKTKMDRVVYLGPELTKMLKRYLQKRKELIERREFFGEKETKSKKLFLSKRGDKGLSLHQYQKNLIFYSKKSGVKATAYMFRHTFATLFIRNHGDIKALKEIMGHKQIETTERYIHEDEERIREQALQYTPEFRV